MIHKPPPFMGLNIRIPIIIPVRRTGFINQGSGLRVQSLGFVQLQETQGSRFGLLEFGVWSSGLLSRPPEDPPSIPETGYG